jgi:sugar phosphate isomerase/epimerase
MPETFDIAISQLTTVRWDLEDDLECLREHGFSALAMWRPKLSDGGIRATRTALARAGVRCSSLQWAGGFTGGDGRTFRESLADAEDAVREASLVGAPVLVLHSGCRGGHTRSHAGRLLGEALESLAPLARCEGVVLAIKPMHPAAACTCSFLTDLVDTLELVESFDDSAIRIALDLWHFGSREDIQTLVHRLVPTVAIVEVADRTGPPTADVDRLPPGYGDLPLDELVSRLREAGYEGDFELDPVGEVVEHLGYAGTVAELGRIRDAWTGRRVIAGAGDKAGAMSGPPSLRQPHHLRGGAGSRRSQASSQAVSRG